MHFADPWVLWLLVLVPAYLWLAWPRRDRPPRERIGWAALPLVADAPRGARARWAELPLVLRAATLALIIVALARPRVPGEVRDERVRGRNVVLALDISSSMKAPDFRGGNRLDVSKRVLADFVAQRPGDFLGLVVFASHAFTQAPLTNDRAVLGELLSRADIGLLPDGTAIGAALAMAERQLADLPRGSGVIVLITDGGNNTGAPPPLTAAAMARALGIRIYAIGVSSRVSTPPPLAAKPATMEAPTPLTDRDEALLRRIASVSGGRYYRAADDAGLAQVMGDVDRLERTELQLHEVRSWRERFAWLAAAAVVLLGIEVALRATWLRRVP